MAQHPETLQLRGLTRRFGSVVAVDGVDLDVPAGQMLGVIGRSGAGKSTLLRMINRLTEPSSGTMRFGAVDVTALTGKALREWRARAAMIFQQFNLVPRLDVLTNVLIGRLSHRAVLPSLLGLFTAEERAMALTLLERFGLRKWRCSAPARCRADSSNAWRSAGRCCRSRSWCWRTNRSPVWIRTMHGW